MISRPGIAGGVVGVVTRNIISQLHCIHVTRRVPRIYSTIIWRYKECFSPGIVRGVGGVHRAVAGPGVHLELPVLALLGDGVHLGEEDCGQQHPACKYRDF